MYTIHIRPHKPLIFINIGYYCLHTCIGYRFAGVLYGITNCAATIPGIVAPIVAVKLTPNVSMPVEVYHIYSVHTNVCKCI